MECIHPRLRFRRCVRLPDGRAAHGGLSARDGSPGDRVVDRGHALEQRNAGPVAPRCRACGQAFHRRRGRQGITRARAPCRVAWRGGSHDVRPRAQIERIGCALIGPTEEMAPADRRMYALRDATATIASVPLLAASIMSKKLAEGLTGLVLDIKRGSGSFLPETERALQLAHIMTALGEDHGCEVVALITAMDRPLGNACGNVLEVEEAIHALRGEGPSDLMEVT